MNILRRVSIVLFAVFFIVQCSSRSKSQDITTIKPSVLPEPELLIDFDQNGMVQPVSIAMMNDNMLSVLDAKQFKVFIFDSEGQFVRKFGREGKGPGEFKRPRYIDLSPGYINIIDAELQRINRFTPSGELTDTYHFKENANNSRISILKNDTYAIGAMGKNGKLIKKVNAKMNAATYFGKAKSDDNPNVRLEVGRQTLAEGKIPALFKNQVTLYAKDNYIYAFLDAYSRVQKYSLDGELLWDTPINLEINDIIFEQAVERAKNAGTDALPSYRYITNMKVIDGQVFLLWMPVKNHPRKLVRINQNGDIASTYEIPEKQPTYFDFAINPSQDELYLSAPQMGQIYHTTLEM